MLFLIALNVDDSFECTINLVEFLFHCFLCSLFWSRSHVNGASGVSYTGC